MDRDAYADALARLRSSHDFNSLGRHQHHAPLKNFFMDDLLTLLYLDHEERIASSNAGLETVRTALDRVVNSRLPRHVRASAAVHLGQFVRTVRHEKFSVLRQSRPRDWFLHARALGSVVGAWEFANELLEQFERRVELNKEIDPLPRVVPPLNTLSNPTYGAVNQSIIEAWATGARVTLRHLQRRFYGWSSLEFDCAFACIVNRLTIPCDLAPDHSSKVRRETLRWLDPVWKVLINVAPEVIAAAHQREGYRAFLIEQRLAVLSLLRSDEDTDNITSPSVSAVFSNSRRSPSESSPRVRQQSLAKDMDERKRISAEATHKAIVVKGPIPASADKEDAILLQQFESLRLQVPFTLLPALTCLHEIESELTDEFPWATEAIGSVLDDLLARRRHGALRLGISPLLLVGPPGSGKTRFAQRLGNKLTSPNIVLNLAGMADSKFLKGCTRGWGGARASRIVEFIQQTFVCNPLIVLDEIDKLGKGGGNSGDPQAALLDLLEPGNAARYQDVYLLAECDLSHCLYIATANDLEALSEPLLTRVRPVLFPKPGVEHTPVLIKGILNDLEIAWSLPNGTLTLSPLQTKALQGLSPREMRAAILHLLGRGADPAMYLRH